MHLFQTILTQPDAHRYANSALGILTVVFETLARITKAEFKESNQNEDIAYTIYTMFTAAVENHSSFLATGLMGITPAHRSLYELIMSELMNCTNKPGFYPLEESCSSLSMGFWYLLQEEVTSNDVCANHRTQALEMIKPVYAHLASVLVRKGQQPDDSQLDQWTAEDLETFRCYRQDISDTMVLLFSIFGFNWNWVILLIVVDLLIAALLLRSVE